MRKPISLYVHVPFCNSKCIYCNFVSKVGNESEKARYVNNLIEEIRFRAKKINPKYEVSTIYIGGGTPSCMSNANIRRVLNEIFSNFTVQNTAEITIEANPESLTFEKAKAFIELGINRISLGLQTANDKLLRIIARRHTYETFETAIKTCKDAGFGNINVDIMLGLPGQTLSNVVDTVNKVLKLDVPHVSAYMLSVEEGTKLAKMIGEGELVLPEEKSTIAMYNKVNLMLKKAGILRYEVSNFAKIGYKSKHNLTYWKRSDYLGLGASAHSFVDNVRFANTNDINEYNSVIEKSLKPPVVAVDEIDSAEAEEEFIMLSLRLAEGMDCLEYEKLFGKNFFAEKKDKIADFIKLGLLIIDGDNIKATDAGFLVLNKIVVELM